MSTLETTALAKRLTAAEVLQIRTKVEIAADKFLTAAQELIALAEPIGCNFAQVNGNGSFARHNRRLAVEPFDRHVSNHALLLQYFDKQAWQFLIDLTGVNKVINSAKRHDIAEAIHKADFPALTAENISATLTGLIDRSHEMMVDGLIDLMRLLSWDYKTNVPCVLGQKFIVRGVTDSHHCAHPTACGALDDLDRVFFLLRGEERNTERWWGRIGWRDSPRLLVGPNFDVKTHKNGNAHVVVHDAVKEHLAQINRLVGTRYPNNLPPPRTKTKRA